MLLYFILFFSHLALLLVFCVNFFYISAFLYRMNVLIVLIPCTAQKMKISIKDFFSKCDQILRKLRIWLRLLKKSFMENFISCAVSSKWYLRFARTNIELGETIITEKKDRIQLVQSHYKKWPKFITKCVRCYKVCQLLQSET